MRASLPRAVSRAGAQAPRRQLTCTAHLRLLTPTSLTGSRVCRKRPLSLPGCTHPSIHPAAYRPLSVATARSANATSSDEFIPGLDSLPTLPMPARAHSKLAPFPLSRLAFGGPLRPAVPLSHLLDSLTSLLTAGGNVVELPRGRAREVAECVRLWQLEQSQAAAAGGGGGVLHVVSVGWRDVVQFIEERRSEWREQQRVDEQIDYRRKRREQIKRQNLAAQQQPEEQPEQQQENFNSLLPRPEAYAGTHYDASADQPTVERHEGAVADESPEEDELLPINRLDLCRSDAPIDFDSLDVFPYLHAHLTALCHVASLSQLPLVLLDDVDLVPEGVRDEYVSRWFIALEQCVLAGRIRHYGVTSAQFTAQLPLHRCVEAAAGILDEPHFAAIRFPLNVYDTRALTELCCTDATSGGQVSVVQYAKQHGLLCIADAGVDAVDRRGNEHRLLAASDDEDEQLADGGTIARQLKGAFNVVLYLEKQLQQLMAGREDELTRLGVSRMELSWAHVMAAQLSLIDNAVRWDRLLHDSIQPTLDRALTKLSLHVSDEPGEGGSGEWERWCRDYRQCTTQLFGAFSASVAHAAESEAAGVAQWLDGQCTEVRRLARLEHKALLLALCSGVDCVCTGEVQRAVELLEAGWKDEELRTRFSGGQFDDSWPERWLSEERALDVMIQHERTQQTAAS